MNSKFEKLYEEISKNYLVGGSDAKVTLSPKQDDKKIEKTSVPAPDSIKGKDKVVTDFDKEYQAKSKEMDKIVKDDSETEVEKRITKEAAYQVERDLTRKLGMTNAKSCIVVEDEKVFVKFWFATKEIKEQFVEDIKKELGSFKIKSHLNWIGGFHTPKFEKELKITAKLETDNGTCPNAVYISINV